MNQAEADYVRSTPRSKALHERALRVMPGGTTREMVYFTPHPLYVAHGQGCRVWDVDGNERLDFIFNYTAQILGYAHPAIAAAIAAQVPRGTAFAAANENEVALAEELCRRVPSLDKVRFCNSGTEATMFALRLAKAFTGRRKIARFEGGYHGTHDFAEVSTHPDLAEAGPADEPRPVPDSIGTPATALEDTIVLPFNNAASVRRVLSQHSGEVAAVIVEPVLGSGGVLPPEPGFLETLRAATSEFGIVLIFDEVISLRVAPGGAQELYGVTPDLTTIGKIIGGGLPVGGFGGRATIMDLLDVRRDGHLPHGGTYNGNPLVMAAGLATLKELTPHAYAELARNGEWLRDRLREVFGALDVPAQVTGVGSLVGVHFTNQPVRDYRSAKTADRDLASRFFFGMLNAGVLFAPRGMICLSTVTGTPELQAFVDAAEQVAATLPKREAQAMPAAG